MLVTDVQRPQIILESCDVPHLREVHGRQLFDMNFQAAERGCSVKLAPNARLEDGLIVAPPSLAEPSRTFHIPFACVPDVIRGESPRPSAHFPTP